MAVLCVPHRSDAGASPLAMIRTTVERSMTILTDPAYQGKDNFHQRITKLEQILSVVNVTEAAVCCIPRQTS
jgi:hypothetical protein